MTTPEYRTRYQDAYVQHIKRTRPEYFKAAGADAFVFPPIKTANGLTKYIINFLLWNGHRATRISVSGRLIDGSVKSESGTWIRQKKWIKSSTRRGTADISATIRGRSVMLEVKTGSDRPSKQQLEEQALERSSGGIYEFISTPDQFLQLYDNLCP